MSILGYKTADLPQAAEFFQDDWIDFIENKNDLKTMIHKYDEKGFEVTSRVSYDL